MKVNGFNFLVRWCCMIMIGDEVMSATGNASPLVCVEYLID